MHAHTGAQIAAQWLDANIANNSMNNANNSMRRWQNGWAAPHGAAG
jgi:hypothetical protein